MSRTDFRAARSGRLAAYAVAAAGPMIAGSAALADVVIVDIATVDASTDFTISLGVPASITAVYSTSFTFSNIGLSQLFYGRVTAPGWLDQSVATNLVGASDFLDSNDNWNGGTAGFVLPATDTTVYLGFRLAFGKYPSNLYGWIEYVNSGGSVTVSRWAYESTWDTGISTPAASTPVVPGLGGLAALACGAAGVRRNRNRVA